MSNFQSIAIVQATQLSSNSNDAGRRDRINAHMVQNVLLIWLDAKIDGNSSDCKNTITQLRHTVNTIQTFTDDRECLQFLEDVADEKACIIISGSLGERVVPRVHNLSQVDSIFIFCRNKKYHERWAKNWSKIKGVFTKIGPICEALKQAAQQCEQNAISISIMDGDVTKTDNRLDPSFMYTQIMKEILLTIKFEQKDINEFIVHCREVLRGNEKQLEYVDQLARQYRQKSPIWWYTCECFLYRMLNRALRLMDADLMIKMGFFIGDLHRQIEQLHQKEFDCVRGSSKKHFTVYRGQAMDKKAFKKMEANKGGLMSFNSFLSTSNDRATSLRFAQHALANNQMVGILFVMNIVPVQSGTPFTSVVDVGYYEDREGEVLFSMHSVFRIGEITPVCGNDRLVQVQLDLANEKDNDLRDLMEYMRKETFPNSSGWYRLGSVLQSIGEFAKAQQVYERLLRQETEESGKVPIYHQLGLMKQEQGEYAEAIEYYGKSIEIAEKHIPCNDLSLAASYNNISSVYCSIGEYPKALLCHEKAWAIQQRLLPSNHPSLASSYNNIGAVYFNMGDYSQALSSYKKALAIKQQSLPSTHRKLAASYNNIGEAYYKMGQYTKALSSHEKALKIQMQSLPTDHVDLAFPYNNIGLVYCSMGDYQKALSFHEKALTIRTKSLRANHLTLAKCYNDIGVLYRHISDYSKALLFHEKALAIRQELLPDTHPDLASIFDNMGLVYQHMGDFAKAHSYFERAIYIGQQSLPANHPDLEEWKKHLIDNKKFI